MDDKLRRVQETHRLDKGRPALLVIDMQHGFLDEGASLEVPKGRDMIGNVQRLAVRFRQAAAPVTATPMTVRQLDVDLAKLAPDIHKDSE